MRLSNKCLLSNCLVVVLSVMPGIEVSHATGQEDVRVRPVELTVHPKLVSANQAESMAVVCGPRRDDMESELGWRVEIVDLTKNKVVNHWDFNRLYREKLGGRWPDEIRAILMSGNHVVLVREHRTVQTLFSIQVRNALAKKSDFQERRIAASPGEPFRLKAHDESDRFILWNSDFRTCYELSKLKQVWHHRQDGDLGIKVFEPSPGDGQYCMFDLYPTNAQRSRILEAQFGRFAPSNREMRQASGITIPRLNLPKEDGWHDVKLGSHIPKLPDPPSRFRTHHHGLFQPRKYPFLVRVCPPKSGHHDKFSSLIEFRGRLNGSLIAKTELKALPWPNKQFVHFGDGQIFFAGIGKLFSVTIPKAAADAEFPITIIPPEFVEFDFDETIEIPIKLTGSYQSYELTGWSGRYEVRPIPSVPQTRARFSLSHDDVTLEATVYKGVRVVNNRAIEINGPEVLKDFLALIPYMKSNGSFAHQYSRMFTTLQTKPVTVQMYRDSGRYRKIVGHAIPNGKTPIPLRVTVIAKDDRGRMDSKTFTVIGLAPTKKLLAEAQKYEQEFWNNLLR